MKSNRKQGIIVLISIMLFLAISSAPLLSYAYPIITSEQEINHTEVKQVVYSIPEKYYEYVNIIKFVKNPICKVYDIYGQQQCHQGWNYVYWDINHKCFNGNIILYNPDLLMHELGHIYELCELKKDITTEEFANSFKIE
jgi:hypothetical protein